VIKAQRFRSLAILLGLTLGVVAPPVLIAGGDFPATTAMQRPIPTDRIIVKFRDLKLSRATKMEPSQLATLSARAGIGLSHFRAMSGDAQVLKLSGRLPMAEVEAIARKLSADPQIEFAEPDQIMRPMLFPNDPQYGNQWHYYSNVAQAPYPAVAGGANLPGAWDITTGSASIVVAVIDTGLVPHADIDTNILDGSGRVVPGYDFISPDAPNTYYTANDGNGRDSDPTDAGDWITVAEDAGTDPTSGNFFQGCGVSNSSWHGTHVSGTIGALSNNNVGVAGINWAAKILPVRVLGKCGGYSSDIQDGIRWAAGIAVSGVPNNNNPAKVLNMSFGGPGTCSLSWQNAVNDAFNAGSVLVVAAGNENVDLASSPSTPAVCNNVISVAAVNRNGARSYYSNYGSVVKIAAPGGEQFFSNDPNGVLSTLNSGTTTPAASPGGDIYRYYQGTSMATPHVVGIVSLMFAANPSLTPTQVLSILQGNARAFPTGTGSDCTISTCGAGIVNAAAAVAKSTIVTVSASDAAASETGPDPGTFTVSRSGSTTAPLTVNYTLGGSATNGTDYSTLSGSVIIGAGLSTASVTVAPIDDSIYEGNETVILTLSASANYGIGTPSSATVTIADNDPPPPATGGGGGRCFIATAAYGSPMASDVRYLRAFRDQYLLTNTAGQWFVEQYYRYSPALADVLREHDGWRAVVRAGLAPLVKFSQWLVNDESLSRQTADRP